MNCPACKEPMIVLELEEVEVDHCVSCGGIWLDAGELELLLGNSAEKDKLLARLSAKPRASFQVDKTTEEKSRRCPICLKRMEKVICGVDMGKEVLIDKCRRNDGMWFDSGELEEIIKMGSFDKENRVINLLKEMFKKI